MSVKRAAVGLAAAVLILLVVVVAGVLGAQSWLATNSGKNWLAARLGTVIGREIDIAGPVEVGFFPPSVAAAGISVRELAGTDTFAQVGALQVGVSWHTLSEGYPILTRLDVHEPRLALRRFADGRKNIDDLIARHGAVPRFAIHRIAIDAADIVWQDDRADSRLTLRDSELAIDHLADAGTAPVRFTGSLLQGNTQTFISATTVVQLDLSHTQADLTQLKINARSEENRNPAGAWEGSGNAKLNWSPFRLDGADWHFAYDEPAAAGRRELVLDIARLQYADGQGSAVLRLAAGDTERGATVLLSGDARYDAAHDDLTLSGLTLEARLPGASSTLHRLTLTGEATARVRMPSATVNLRGALDDAPLQMNLGLTRASPPAFTFAANLASLNADAWTGGGGPRQGSHGTTPARAAAAPQPFDLTGIVHVGTLRYGALRAKHITLTARWRDGRLEWPGLE